MAEPNAASKLLGYAHTGLTVRSLDTSLRFWHEALGCPVLFRASFAGTGTTVVTGAPAGTSVRIALLGLPIASSASKTATAANPFPDPADWSPESTPMIELCEQSIAEEVGEEAQRKVFKPRSWDVGSTHIAFFVRGLDGMVERVREEGWGVVGGVYAFGDGDPEKLRGQRVCYVRGPDGETVELIEPPPPRREEAV